MIYLINKSIRTLKRYLNTMLKKLDVYISNKQVGTLALMNDGRVAFSYTDEWIENGFSISPLSLPLQKRVFIPSNDNFEGLFGVFGDSLPDGWGRLLLERYLKEKNIEANILDRLSLNSKSSKGALEYRPNLMANTKVDIIDYDKLCKEFNKIFDGKEVKDFDKLFVNGGSSGGARPKAHVKIDGIDYIVKFPSSLAPKDIGIEEYEYNACARKCGIEISDFRLIPSKICKGFFATKRFDRCGRKRIHTISVAGLLETSYHISNLDYLQLLKLTNIIAKDINEVYKMYRLMCFNVFAHNLDDHSKNFSFIYRDRRYVLSPAYDLTYSNSYNFEHTTTVNDKGNPTKEDLIEVGLKVGLKKEKINEIIDSVNKQVKKDLGKYLKDN